MTHIRDWPGKTRVPHECRVCGETIPTGSDVHMYHGVTSDEGFYSLWFHDECWDYSREWHDDEWESLPPGSVSRKEIEQENRGIV